MPGITTLACLLDTNELTASSRYASILTSDPYKDVKQSIIDGDEHYREQLSKQLPNVKVVFKAPTLEDVFLQVDAWEQRYGTPPDLLVIDNLGNQSGMFDNEWAVLKSMTLELDQFARQGGIAVIACHHTTDLPPDEPAARDKILGKVSQFCRVALSVGYNAETGEFKIAVVKNSEGKTDAKAERPVILYADAARMQLSEHPFGRPGQALPGSHVSGREPVAAPSPRGTQDDDGPPW